VFGVVGEPSVTLEVISIVSVEFLKSFEVFIGAEAGSSEICIGLEAQGAEFFEGSVDGLVLEDRAQHLFGKNR